MSALGLGPHLVGATVAARPADCCMLRRLRHLWRAYREARRLGDEAAEWRMRLQQTDIRFWRSPEATVFVVPGLVGAGEPALLQVMAALTLVHQLAGAVLFWSMMMVSG